MGILIKNIICFNEEGAEGPLNGPKGRCGPEGPPSPPQELEGRARSALNFYYMIYVLQLQWPSCKAVLWGGVIKSWQTNKQTNKQKICKLRSL